MATLYGANVVRDGLVLSLDAANVKSYPGSGTTWYDMSGHNNHATRNGTTSYSSWNSQGWFEHRPENYFGATDGSSNAPNSGGSWWSIDHSSSLSPNGGFWSVFGWLKVIGDQSGNGVGWFHKIGSSDERGIHLEPISGNFRANGSNGWSQMDYNIDNTGIWQNFCATFDQTSGVYGTDYGELNFYINGVKVFTDSDFIPKVDSGGEIWLMRRNGHLRHFMEGDVSLYQYYTKKLSAAEIRQNFNATRGRFGI